MNVPGIDDHPLSPSDRMHLRLAERGSALLPEAGNEDGRVSLSDAMLAVAALACCLALFRESIGLGLASLVLVLPSLARTHAVMIRHRAEGPPPNVVTWAIAFGSSIIRVGLMLGLCSLAYVASLLLGTYIGHWFVLDFLSVGSRFAGVVEGTGGFLLALPTTFLVMACLTPWLLSVRERLEP